MNGAKLNEIVSSSAYKTFLSQQYISGFKLLAVSLLMLIILVVSVIVIVRIIKRRHKDATPEAVEREANFVLLLGGTILVALVISAISAYFGASKLLNPDYYALKDLLSRVK